MIDFLRGRLAYMESDFIVLDVQGVGYRVFCPNPYGFAAKKEEELTVYVHHHVREDAVLLFGFPTREEQGMFRLLLEVSGIGPRVALGILSGARPDAVADAVAQENLTFLTKLPGIGKKTAQRLILDLKDKLAAAGAGSPGRLQGGTGAADAPGVSGAPGTSSAAWHEAKEALLALGYTEAECARAWQAVKAEAEDIVQAEVLIKLALKALYKN